MRASFVQMMARDRERLGFSIGQAAWRIGVSPREYRELEAGMRSPTSKVWERMVELYGWPRPWK